MKKERESAFELLRIIAQFMIVFYHILYFIVYPASGEPFLKAIWYPLHIGVPLFVFISGYFGIKPSVKGFVKLAGMVFVLQLPSIAQDVVINGLDDCPGRVFKLTFFISYTPFWFVRTYVFLYLFSPVINKFLDSITLQRRIYLLAVLFYLGIYIAILGADGSLKDGKNLITFLLYYVVGNTLRTYKANWQKYDMKKIVCVFVIFNSIVVALFSCWCGRFANFIWNRLFFTYCSPMLLLNAIIFFIIIGKLDLKSKIINDIAKSSLAIFIIHRTFLFSLIGPLVMYFYGINNSICLTLLNVTSVTVITLILCVVFYWALSPVWKMINRAGGYVQEKVDNKLDSYNNHFFH